MKKFGLIYVIVVAIFATSCNDELVEQQIPAADGSGIIFGGRAGFEGNDPDSRTVYTGQTYTHDNKTFERIDWVIGDKIEIYSTDASNGPSAHYGITSITTGDEGAGDTGKGSDYGYLESLAESSLQWNGDGDHTFYAMYPSASMFIAEDGSLPTVAQGIKLDESGDSKVVVKGTVPSSQPGTITENDGNFTVKPDMKYAYMVAKSIANRADGLVKLSFVPIVTAVEVEMIVPTNADKDVHDVMMAEIQVTGTGIAGDFTADLTSWESGYPTCTNVGEGHGTIQISTWLNNKPITIQEGKSVKFTVFMRPGADPSNLKVSYSPAGSSYFSKSLQGITIPAKLKTRITNFKLPATFDEDTQITADASKWMSQLPRTTALKKLSIPGTGGSFSYKYTTDASGYYRSQHTHMDLEAQWKKGIRAFEIITDRQADNFGNEKLKCNGVDMGTNVQTVVNELLTKLDNTFNEETNLGETAMLIFTYQPEGNTYPRDPQAYVEKLMAYINTLSSDRLEKYSPDLTLEQAQKKLMIVVRPTQYDEDASSVWTNVLTEVTGTNANKVLLINGCGTAKDRWGARGYTVTSQKYTRTQTRSGGSFLNPTYTYSYTYTCENIKAKDISNGYEDNSRNNSKTGSTNSYGPYYDYVEAYMATNGCYSLGTSSQTSYVQEKSYSIDIDKNEDDGTTSKLALTLSRGKMNFAFPTNDSFECWYQEWQRVVESNVYKNAGNWQGSSYASYPGIYWFESLNEKVSNVISTFDMSVSGEYSNYVFINSLCGYLAKNDDTESLTPSLGYAYGGNEGDIKSLAKELNEMFYKHVLNSGFEQKTGATGVVLMDYVNNVIDTTVEYDGSFYLPDVIISNNFKHNLGDDSTTGGGGTGNDEGEEEEG